jgi:hypothetical protein
MGSGLWASKNHNELNLPYQLAIDWGRWHRAGILSRPDQLPGELLQARQAISSWVVAVGHCGTPWRQS